MHWTAVAFVTAWAVFSVRYTIEDGSSGMGVFGWLRFVFLFPGLCVVQEVAGVQSNAALPLIAAVGWVLFSTLAVAAAEVVTVLRRGPAGAVGASPSEADRPAVGLDPAAELRDAMQEVARDAVAVAADHGVVLDYSEASLAAVDELLGRESFVGCTPRAPASPDDEERLWTCAKLFGGYVGEVVRREFGGRWILESSAAGKAVVLETRGATLFPMDKVWKRLTQSEFDGVGGYCRLMRAVLERAVRES